MNTLIVSRIYRVPHLGAAGKDVKLDTTIAVCKLLAQLRQSFEGVMSVEPSAIPLSNFHGRDDAFALDREV